ncbi:MAG: hypothetical protein QG623_55 [Patescibacteria group bacterium]|nr:hypothetical protein [Patescibacteria group bacterium]
MILQNISFSLRNNPNTKNFIKFIVGSTVIVIMAIILWPQKNYPQYQAIDTMTDYSMGNPYLSDSKLYGYNGLAFYSQELTGGSKPKVLYYSADLPKVSQIAWAGESGALVNFKTPLYSTAVERKLISIGEELTVSAESYTWYLDFNSGDIELFSTNKLEQGSVLYSKIRNGFYYYSYPAEQGEDQAGRSPLYVSFFDIKAKQYSSSSEALLTSQEYYLANCSTEEYILCIVAQDDRDNKTISINALDEKGKFSKLFTVPNKPIPTNDPDYFIVPTENNSQVEIRRLSTASSKILSLEFAEPNPTVFIDEGLDGNKLIYVLDNSLSKEPNKKGENQKYIYAAGELDPVSLSSSFRKYDIKIGEDKLKERFIASSNFSGSPIVTALQTFKGNTVLFTSKKIDYSFIKPLDEEKQKKLVESCMEDPSENVQYLSAARSFNILINYKLNVDQELSKFVECIESRNPNSMLGYEFVVRLYDPISRKFVR